MQKFFRIICWFSIALLIFCVMAPFIGRFIPLTYTDGDGFFDGFSAGIPLAILLTLSGTLKKDDPVIAVIVKIGATVFVSAVSLYILALVSLGDMCTSTVVRTLFENKYNHSDKIVLRSFGCGATDSTSPTYGVVRAKYLTSHLFWRTDIDTTKLDRTVWVRVVDKGE